MRIKIVFSYDGNFFHGFQRQRQEKSVQETLEKTISKILKEDIVIKGSGRTDARVHAMNQVAHFDTNKKLPRLFKQKLNKELSSEIKIKKINKVANIFHARHSAKGKYYIYKINLGKYKSKYNGYIYQPKKRIDINKIKEIKDIFIGTYSFHNFTSGKRENYITTIYKIKVKRKGKILELHFIGKAFYRYMVRNLVGALLDYAWNNVDRKTLYKMLNDESYIKQLKTVPAEGLYLRKVYY